ncbi:hypothetical protein D3C74_155310 [compost metagenome]
MERWWGLSDHWRLRQSGATDCRRDFPADASSDLHFDGPVAAGPRQADEATGAGVFRRQRGVQASRYHP